MKVNELFSGSGDSAVPLYAVSTAMLDGALSSALEGHAGWLRSVGFSAAAGKIQFLPGEGGQFAGAVFGLGADEDAFACAALPSLLPAGLYRFALVPQSTNGNRLALAWALGHYSFSRFKSGDAVKPRAVLAWPADADRGQVLRMARGMMLARDLVNTPANAMGPQELAGAAASLAHEHGALFNVIEGRALVENNFPMIWAVGAGSSRAPRLVEFTWGDRSKPQVTLVGKGVCFDSGGLDIKSSSAMLTMKKDMGGAAVVLGVARAIMAANLPVRLRVLVPAVENAVSGNAFRPLDVIKSRAGITVEIGNTDAEGRLILADALAEAVSENPDLLIDCATLTGAARIAVGPDLPALFTDDETLAADLLRHGLAEADRLWRLPLHAPYRAMLNSSIADISSTGEGGLAGSITAALFLKEFAGKARSWAHIDLYAWNQKSRPGRPAGGEAMALRAIYAMIAERYGTSMGERT